jgi:hypothetical protein
MTRSILASAAALVLLGSAALNSQAMAQNDPNAGPGPRTVTGPVPERGVAPASGYVADTRYAVVNADCTIARSLFGPATCQTSGTGNYIIRFNRNVRNCAYTATIGLSGASGTEAPGFITVVGAAVDVKGVFVTTDDTTGASANRGFHLLVSCR